MTGVEHVEVAIVGGGPAGLTAAVELRRRGIAPVLVIERENEAGGIPRHADHQGFGVGEFHRPMSGPAYARRLVDAARGVGAELRVRSQVTGWTPEGGLEVTAPDGRVEVRAGAVVLATGCRERSRSARLIPGSRPQGVMSTGTLQQIVNLAQEPVGRRAVVVGAEHVSFSAIETLARGGARTVAMTTELPDAQSFTAFRIGALARYGVRVRTRTAVSTIHGQGRVEAVELVDLDTGAVETVECDTVVLTADWIPDHELAVLAGAALHGGTRGPIVDRLLRTTRPGLFAAGNVLHGAEPADVAALTGRDVADSVRAYLDAPSWQQALVTVRCEEPLHWIVPNAVATDVLGPPAGFGPFRLRAREQLRGARIEIFQGDRALGEVHAWRVMAGRSTVIGGGWSERVDPSGPEIVVRVGAARPRRRARRHFSDGNVR